MRSGAVTGEMLACPKLPFMAVGALEAVAGLTQMTLAAKLPGALLPLLAQSVVMWQLALTWLLLGKRYTVRQVASAAVVVVGVVLAGLPSGAIDAVRPLDALVYSASMALVSLAVLMKEKIFRDNKERLGGKDLDLFVVNSTGSAFQALFVFLSLPVLTKLRGLSLAQMPEYVASGASALINNPTFPALYVVCNLAFNITALYLLRGAGCVPAGSAAALNCPPKQGMLTKAAGAAAAGESSQPSLCRASSR